MAQVERMSYRTGFVARLEEAAHLPAITIGRPTSPRMCSRSSITTSSTLQEDLRRSERERSHSTRCRGRPQGESRDGSIRLRGSMGSEYLSLAAAPAMGR